MVLVSHKYNFIYIKTYKTASTSVEVFFQRWCVENEDAYIPNEEADYVRNTHGIIGYRPFIHNESKTFYSHSPSFYLKKLLPKCFQKYFKFCVIRNPFDIVVSQYYYQKQKHSSFDDFVDTLFNTYQESKNNTYTVQDLQFDKKTFVHFNWELITINDVPVMDFYIRYENLIEDIEHVLQKLGIKNYDINDLKTYKGGFREETGYRQFYNDITKEKVETIYKKYLSYFGYVF